MNTATEVALEQQVAVAVAEEGSAVVSEAFSITVPRGLSEDTTKLYPSFDIPRIATSLSWPRGRARALLFRGRVRWQAQGIYDRSDGAAGGKVPGAWLKPESWRKMVVYASCGYCMLPG